MEHTPIVQQTTSTRTATTTTTTDLICLACGSDDRVGDEAREVGHEQVRPQALIRRVQGTYIVCINKQLHNITYRTL